MASDEALRAAKAIRAARLRGDRPSSAEADAEIIDGEFKALRYRLELQELDENSWELEALRNEQDKLRGKWEIQALRDERDRLRRALGWRGRHDCPLCQGRGTVGVFRGGGECECRKELGL